MGEGTGLGTEQDCFDAFTFLGHVPICAADSANFQVVEHLCKAKSCAQPES